MSGFPEQGADVRGSPGNFRASPGNFRGTSGKSEKDRGTSGFLLSSTVREVPGGELPGKFGELPGKSGDFPEFVTKNCGNLR